MIKKIVLNPFFVYRVVLFNLDQDANAIIGMHFQFFIGI